MAELDAQARRRRARRRSSEADHLGLALPPVAAVAKARRRATRVRHELRDARRQLAEVGERPGERPVRLRARLAEEVDPASAGPPTSPGCGLRDSGSARAPRGARGVEHDLGDRSQEPDVVVGVEVRGRPPHERLNFSICAATSRSTSAAVRPRRGVARVRTKRPPVSTSDRPRESGRPSVRFTWSPTPRPLSRAREPSRRRSPRWPGASCC